MVKNYTTPLNIQIINKGKNTSSFVPYRENENFPVEAGGKVSFVVNSSEAGLYYEKQNRENLSVVIAENNNVALECGSGFDLDTFEKGASFSAVLESKEENTYNYSVIGTLPYSEATPSIGMPAGNRFITRFVNPSITERADLPSGKICVVDVEGGSHNEYTKSAFEEDGSLIVVVNAVSSSKITVSIDWEEDVTTNYVFTFKDIKLGAENEVLKDLQDIDIKANQSVTLINKTNRTIGFVPYKENFVFNIEKENEITLETKTSEEVLYYLLQNSEDLEVTL